MRPVFAELPPVRPGDRVAVVSPSYAAPADFPAVHERGLAVLRGLGLVPVEYPTTRRHSGPAQRAADLMAAFADDSVRAVLATIGGDDQLTVLPHLDPAVIRPKPFAGYSDNTNLLNWLWNLGVPALHGGSTMVHLGRAGGPHPDSLASLRAALFRTGDVVLRPAAVFAEEDTDWAAADPRPAPVVAHPGWSWHQPSRVVTGPVWGGNLEILHWNLAAGRWIRPAADYAGCVLLLETSEETPSAAEVYRMLRNAGERGLLGRFPAVLVGLARACRLFARPPAQERAAYRADQRAAVLRAFGEYAPDAMIVFDVDVGHTDPQWVLPYGGLVTVDGPARRVTAHW
ncbi:S66 family peptidase [Spirilliplanes yamanashiensis]|nr:S66 peptidase family protein [Spirilliplanes yamanashiensis]MDP9817925.1 muramoyltetrapeptide carboxypeptidase LdcA involved in peptidoglycan recycling [Spirilliplanes yamanashiensis]